MTEPRSGAELWAQRMRTSELNRLLSDSVKLGREDAELLKAVENEKDRRLADPNGDDFRPQFN